MAYLLTGPQKKLSIIGIGISAFMISTEFYIVGAIIPVLMQYFDATFATVQWVILIYTFILTVMVLGVSKLGDIYDKKQLFLLGLGLFVTSSLLCGFAPNITILIIFRGLQGLGAVLIWALRNAIITEIFPSEERGQAIGWVTGISSLGLAIGPGLGGLLIGIWDWRLLFWINLPFGLIAGIFIAHYMPSCTENEGNQKVDIFGLLLMTLTLGCFVSGITRMQSLNSFGLVECALLGLSVIGLLYFLNFESRIEEPLLDLELLRQPKININLILFVSIYIIVGLIQLAFPLFLELGLHYSAEKVGFLLTFLPLSSVVVAPASGSLSDRLGGRIVTLSGLALIMIGCAASATLHSDATALGFCARGILIELGLIISVIPISKVVMDSVKQEQLGIASGLLALSRMLGILIGTCLFGLLFLVFTLIHNDLLPDFDKLRLSAKSFDLADLATSDLIQGTDAIFLFMTLIALSTILVSIFYLSDMRDEGADEVSQDVS